jgi:hypothetical protein
MFLSFEQVFHDKLIKAINHRKRIVGLGEEDGFFEREEVLVICNWELVISNSQYFMSNSLSFTLIRSFHFVPRKHGASRVKKYE